MRTYQCLLASVCVLLPLVGSVNVANAQRRSENDNRDRSQPQSQQSNQSYDQSRQSYDQSRGDDQNNGQRYGDSTDRRQPTRADREIASCVAWGNYAELQIAQHAKQRVKDQDVRSFIDTLVKDHNDFAQKLQRFTGTNQNQRTADYRLDNDQAGARGTQRGDAGVGAQNQLGQSQDQFGQDQGNRGQQGYRRRGEYTVQRPIQNESNMNSGLNWPQLKQELSKQCISSAKEELDEKDGSDVDKCFIGMQIAAHQHMLDELQVLRRHASRDLRAVLYEGISTTEEHLDKAKELMKEMTDSSRRSRDDSNG